MKVRFVDAKWTLIALFMFATSVSSAKAPPLSAPRPKGKLSLLNSYLPAAMHLLAHYTNQMKYERPLPTAEVSTQASPPKDSPASMPSKPGTTSTTPKYDLTTHSHKPGIFAPIPPESLYHESKPLKAEIPDPVIPLFDDKSRPVYPEYLPPVVHEQLPHGEYSKTPISAPSFPVILPAYPYKTPSEDSLPLYYPGNYQGSPYSYSHLPALARSGEGDDLVVPDDEQSFPDISSLPVQNEENYKSNPLEIEPDELSDENLQYLSPVIRDMLKSVRNNKDDVKNFNPTSSFQTIEELFDDPEEKKDVGDWLRAKKPAPTASYIQMLLLYDLLSRDAKTQKLNNYNGYTEDLINDLSETSKGTAIDQLKAILERMVARGDCTHDFANNRARDMAKELEKPDSKIAMELRYLDPFHFTP